MIDFIDVSKEYLIPDSSSKKLRNFLWKPSKKLLAINNVSFSIGKDEIIGLIGHNGAGKSTIIKMISGILTPSKGQISVMGYTPIERKKVFLSQIGVMMGNKSMLFYDLPVEDSFKFFSSIYGKTSQEYTDRIKVLTDNIGLTSLLKTPVRKLSLGQRMKAEIILSIIHCPQILLLDEPTIGLDINSKKEILLFIKELNREYGTVIFLTSHDLNDIEYLCKRIILIDSGVIRYSGNINEVSNRNEYKIIEVQGYDLSGIEGLLNSAYELITCGLNHHKIVVKSEMVNNCLDILRSNGIDDISINKPNLEFVLSRME